MENDVLESPPTPPLHSAATPAAAVVSSVWHRFFHRFICGLYFQRITLIHPERLPKTGPTLYLGLHRNGAVDGFVYDQVLGHPVFMISTQLRKNWFARLFFTGITVNRTKDEGDRDVNDAALRRCLDHLRSSGQLFVFPEGTSSLGPRHLPFKSGAVWLCLEYIEQGGPPLNLAPVGIHYECPWAFRGKVEVVVGAPISVELPPGASRMERLRTMKRRVETALAEVGINVPSEEDQQRIQSLASFATCGTAGFYFKFLKSMEKGAPEKIVQEWHALEHESKEARLWFHQGAPLFPIGAVVFELVELSLLGPVVAAALVLNLPPFLAGWYAGRKFPDDRNVISLWKILVGVPIFVLWIGAVVLTFALLGHFAWLAAYGAVTWAGIKFYRRSKELAVAVHNALVRPALRKRALALRQSVLQSLPDETA
jgi:1-acyl-sn-glycerol-3-phosphate acyltransferase